MMLRVLLALAFSFALASPSWATGFPALINFRGTTAFIADGAGESADISGTEVSVTACEAYPVTKNGITFGWNTASTQCVNVNVTPGADFAGYARTSSGTRQDFQLDLPQTGIYTIRLAMGDFANAGTHVQAEVYDNTTLLFTAGSDTTTSGANKFIDAVGAEYSAAAWPGSNTARTVTFNTTTMIVHVGVTTQTNGGYIAHLEVAYVGPNTALQSGGAPMSVIMGQ